MRKPEEIRKEIQELVKEFYGAEHAEKKFVRGESKVHYAGRVFDEKELSYGVDSILDFWLTLGRFGDEFESRLKDYTGVRDVVLVNSGSSANLVAVTALLSNQLERPLAEGDEVITPAVTFPSTLSPIIQNGLTPVFVDCELGNYNLDCSKLEEAMSGKVRAIMVPHTLGNFCNMDVLLDFAKQHKLIVVEDGCDALGSKWDGKMSGTMGVCGTISFYPAHHITMGEGGAIVTNDEQLSKVLRSVRDWGRDCWCPTGSSNTCGRRFSWKLGDLPFGYDHKYVYSHIGYNLKPSEMQAAIGAAQIQKLPSFVEARKKNFKCLFSRLSKHSEFLLLPTWYPKADPSWFGFPITVKENPLFSRNDLTGFLEKNKVETRLLFAGNITRQPAFLKIKKRVAGNLANTDTVMDRTFFIGVYPGISDDMADYVADIFDQFIKEKTKGK